MIQQLKEDKRAWAAFAGIGLALAIALTGFVRGRSGDADAASLKAQRAALGDRGGPAGGPGGGPQAMFSELGLTDAQQAQVEGVFRSFRPSPPAAGQRPDPSQFQAQFVEMEAKLATILTPEQLAKFRQLAPPQGGPMGGPGMGGRMDAPTTR